MATQKGRNWSSGDIVTAANLSSIERGVSALAEEYTPTAWANGNTVTAAGLNNIEQGIVNAGGGSSDFSTAQVTISGSNGLTPLSIPTIGEWSEQYGIAFYADDGINQVLLYKGVASFYTPDTLVVTGNCHEDPNDPGEYFITGDCTIIISDSSGDIPIST